MTVGDFADGSDTMLWNPAVTAERWHRLVSRAFLEHLVSTRCAAGLLVLALGIAAPGALAGAMTVGGGIALLLSGVCNAFVAAACLATDHEHRQGHRCRLERSRGEFFLRSADFTALGEAATYQAGLLVDLLSELHDSRARDWLDSELCDRAHQVVWAALVRLTRTESARQHAARLKAAPGETELAATTASAIAEFDTQLDELIFHLQGCVTLAREWEAKLRHAEIVEHTETVHAGLRAASIRPFVVVAEELPQSVFAYVTAARDLTGAGRFPWEPPATEPIR
ncbi:hypothetical protein MUY14_43125 [Amycolatopsis sp. FBCC-B4732]|uniref:hypothetical protein n=1 Tax=Amycolatopsis sp. FBCC-B4732 TaxID=3079339 RepID=UPI001FF3A1AD|nr:hypothetical protein [Amycolatopsis sp. FBCC-B4732]UOX88405.1 hypothetical protein MUY14_43125 [Amycolatopsis sp. FBCC-B4732]